MFRLSPVGVRSGRLASGRCRRTGAALPEVVERDVSGLLAGPVFEPIRSDPGRFREVRVEGGALVWPNGADQCPDVVIWGEPPPPSASQAGPVMTDDGLAASPT